MKALIFILVFASSVVFASENKYAFNRNGNYVGSLEDGSACLLKVTNVKKNLFRTSVTSMNVEVNFPDYVGKFSLICKNYFMSGHECNGKSNNVSFLVTTYEDFDMDMAPFSILANDSFTRVCRDLVLN